MLWLFGPEKFPGLSRNGHLVRDPNLLFFTKITHAASSPRPGQGRKKRGLAKRLKKVKLITRDMEEFLSRL